MLKTMNRDEWREDPVELRLMDSLTPESSPVLMRRLFPLQGRLQRFCRINSLPVGTLMEYVRTKHIPAHYPLEAIVIRDGRLYKSSYNTDELVLISEV